MTETRAISELTPEIWDDRFSTEFFQKNPFSAYSGTGRNSIIRIKEDLKSKRADGITFEFITNLKKGAITGRTPLKGNESRLGEYGDKVSWDMRKKAISVHELDEDLAAIDLRKASKESLRDWADEDVKHEVISKMLSVGNACNVNYDDGDAAEKNAWNANNQDRVLYGKTRTNYNATHSTALATIDATNDKYQSDSVSLMKRMGLMANPRITPIKVEEMNRRVFVTFVHPYLMRDIRASIEEVQKDVSIVKQNKSIFLGGDVDYDGMLIHEVDDMPIIEGVGDSGIDVAPAIMCGAEALGWAVKSRYSSRKQEDDYGQVCGLGMIGKWGIKKLCYNYGTDQNIIGKQRGMVTGFFAATGD